MIKLHCKLKQQTPLLHFQPDESGACLRGTEVKPKLDKFIIKCYLKREKSIPDHWFLETKQEKRKEKENFALNYKIRFEAQGTPQINDGSKGKPINKSFFGNQGIKDKAQLKKTVLYDNPIELTILCFIPDLLEFIKEYIEDFFVIHNFGTRQTKGFGAFIVSEINGTGIDYENRDYLSIVKKYIPYGLYYEYRNVKIAEKNVLEDIRIIYGLMKSGFNLTSLGKDSEEDYFKGYIFRYFSKKYPSYMNDKKFIKTHLEFYNQNSKEIEKIEGENDNREGIYCRALLGLAQQYEYKKTYEGTVKIIEENLAKENEKTDEVGDKAKGIARFPSPILWTVAGKYLLAMPMEEEIEYILNKRFSFVDSQGNSYDIRTPREFDFKDFLYGFQEDFNDKKTPKGGKIGLAQAENGMLLRAKSLKLSSF